MKDTKDRLYELLPAIYRQRDAEQGLPLKALLRVLSEQLGVVEADIAQLYENWFIETCQDWVVPYIGDLAGFEPVFEAGQPGEITTTQGRERNKILVPRAEVANTIRNRRRKGTLALLELLARDVAGWPARAVEFYVLLGMTQSLNHLRLNLGRTVDLRNGDALSRLDGPFDELAHTIDVRRPNSHRSQGKYNIPSVGLFIWRMHTYSVTRTPAYYVEGSGMNAYTFSVLANDLQLYSPWRPEPEPTQIAGELNLPAPIRLKGFEEVITQADGTEIRQASAHYYGADKSLAVWASDDWAGWANLPDADRSKPIPRKAIVPADLSTWQYEPKPGFVAVDPEFGRMVFPPNQLPKKVWVFYHYGFSADIGGGEYDRPLFQPADSPLLLDDDLNDEAVFVSKLKAPSDPVSNNLFQQLTPETQALFGDETTPPDLAKLRPALLDELNRLMANTSLYDLPGFRLIELRAETRRLLEEDPQDDDLILLNRMLLEDAYKDEIALGLVIFRVGEAEELKRINDALASWQRQKPRNAIIEITDSGAYTEQIKIDMIAGKSLQIRAANLRRPVLRLLDYTVPGPDALTVNGAARARFTVDGLLFSGRGIEVKGEMEEVNIRHTTLVPGWEIGHDCEPERPKEASLYLLNTNASINVSHSLIGSILVRQDEIKTDPISIHLSDSALDATSHEEEALGEPGCPAAHAILRVVRSTVIGQVQTHAIELAENSIFTGLVTVARRQIGCMRFCYVPPGSRTPRRYNCQPDLVEKPIRERFKRNEIDQNEMQQALEGERLRVRPQFNSDPPRYGLPDYGRPADTGPAEIKRGADDESEMGVFHDLYQPQREANLRTRLDEYTPAGMDAGIFFAS